MKEVFYYYLRDEQQKAYGCVAINENDDGTINRGVSLCSHGDVFVKRCARNIAFQRLQEAMKKKKSIPFNRYNGFARGTMNCPVDLDDFELSTRSAYGVVPNAYEYRMLHKPE